MIKGNKYKTGWQVIASFVIGLHNKDLALLKQIQSFFGVGRILKQGNDATQFWVQSIKDLKVIIAHFDKYPLVTQKRADFELFKKIVEMMSKKEHLTHAGLQEIVNLRASINRGLSDTLTAAFPNTKPVPRPLVVYQEIKDPNWIAGFTSGEGCFNISSLNSSSHKSSVRWIFKITQHSRDAELIKSLVEYLDCGAYYPYGAREASDFVVQRLSDINEKIIPFFEKYPIVGVKALDFADFCKVAKIMKVKGHLTESGLDEIRKIKAGMNRGRES